MSNRDDFDILLEKRFAGHVTADEQARLKSIIAADATLRAEFLIAVSQEAALKSIHRAPPRESEMVASTEAPKAHGGATPNPQCAAKAPSKSQGGQRPSKPWLAPLGACALLGVAVLLYLAFGRAPTTSRAAIAKLRDPGSGISVTRDGRSLAVSNAMDLIANDEIRCAQGSAARIEYTDTTRIDLTGDTTLTVDPAIRTSRGKCIRVERGHVTATVSEQPADTPMRFVSAHAEALVVGTQLDVDADTRSTKLSVIEGKVRFTSLRDGKSLELAAGEYAIAGEDAVFAVARINASQPAKSARIQTGVLALYTFRDGGGNTVKDSSEGGDPANLFISDARAVAWLKGGGLDVHGVVTISAPATKLLRACRNSGEITIELWLKAAPVAPNTLRYVVTFHGGPGVHLMEIAQHGEAHSAWQFMLETSNQSPHHHSAPAPAEGPRVPAAETLTHVVFTRSAAGTARSYVNGVEQSEAQMPGDLSSWSDQHFLSIAGDGSQRVWAGEFHLLAIYARALNSAEVKTNFDAGP